MFFSQIDIPSIPTTHEHIYGSYSFPNYPDPEDLPEFFGDYENIDLEALMIDVSYFDWSNFFAADVQLIYLVFVRASCSASKSCWLINLMQIRLTRTARLSE
jgi:hypothetical protein